METLTPDICHLKLVLGLELLFRTLEKEAQSPPLYVLILTFMVEFTIGVPDVAVSAAREMMDFSEKGAKSAPCHQLVKLKTYIISKLNIYSGHDALISCWCFLGKGR